MSKFQKDFGKRLKELRIRANISQEQFAEKLGMATKTISYWENGHNAVTFNKLPAIAEVLNLPVYQLFVFDNLATTDNNKLIGYLDTLNEKERKIANDVVKLIISLR